MSDTAVIWATAVYNVNRPCIMLVTEDRDKIERIVPIQVSTLNPRRIALVSTPYRAPKGSSWEETRPGVYVIPVYRDEG